MGLLTDLLGDGNATSEVGLLARKQHAPASLVTYSTTSTTFVDVDATNLAVTFTAPPSGSVRVVWEAMCEGPMFWALRSGVSDVASSLAWVTGGEAINSGDADRYHVERVMSGLTPGTSYSWKWAFKSNSGTGTGQMYASDTDQNVGPALLEVWGVK